MSEELSTNGKFNTAIINYLSENYVKGVKPLLDRRYIKSYLNTGANNYLSELYN